MDSQILWYHLSQQQKPLLAKQFSRKQNNSQEKQTILKKRKFLKNRGNFLEKIEKRKTENTALKRKQNPRGIWEFALIPYHETKR